MDYIILLIIGLGIIFGTYFSKLKNKYGLIFIFLIYLGFLLFVGFDIGILNNFSSYYFIDFSDFKILNVVFGIFFFIFYFLIYYIVFYFRNKKLNLINKLYFLIRDFYILYLVFFFFFFYTEVAGKYMYYHEWYKSDKAFNSQEYKCYGTDAILLLEHRYKDKPIVKLYNNFYDFYKAYGKVTSYSAIPTNGLNPELINKKFLKTCLNKKGENYYDNYVILHGDYIRTTSERDYNYGTKKYYISDEEVKKILNKLNK